MSTWRERVVRLVQLWRNARAVDARATYAIRDEAAAEEVRMAADGSLKPFNHS